MRVAEILTTRVVMILSVLLSAVGVLVATLGMRCTRCLEEDEKQKDRVAIVGGFLFIIAGTVGYIIMSVMKVVFIDLALNSKCYIVKCPKNCPI